MRIPEEEGDYRVEGIFEDIMVGNFLKLMSGSKPQIPPLQQTGFSLKVMSYSNYLKSKDKREHLLIVFHFSYCFTISAGSIFHWEIYETFHNTFSFSIFKILKMYFRPCYCMHRDLKFLSITDGLSLLYLSYIMKYTSESILVIFA